MVTPELPSDLREVARHLESCYPNEGCGVLLHGPGGRTVRPLDNVYDRYHLRDPERFPRTSRTAYLFDPREWLKVSEQADDAGQQVRCVFHSHADVGAYFSKEDRDMAAPDGELVLPGVSYLVVAVDAGVATGARLFWWESGNFQETPVPAEALKP